MNEGTYVSTTRMIASVLWGVVAVITLVGWALLLLDYRYRVVAIMLAGTASSLSAVAAVAHIRLYTMKVTKLIRMTNGLSPAASERGTLHRVP